MTILYFIIALGVLIFIHEFGHFLLAKRAGVRVETFSLGFGPKLIGFQRGETFYKISVLPLGGYVKLTGEDPESEEADHPKSFANKGLAKRFQVVFAGPAMNLFLTLALMPLVFMLGRSIPAYLEKVPVVQEVISGSPAAEAGLQMGDKILTIDGHSVDDWGDFIRSVILKTNSKVELRWERDGRAMQQSVQVTSVGKSRMGAIGIEPSYVIGEAPVIDEVQEGSPAEQAGLQAKDRVRSINGVPINTWSEMSEQVQASEGKTLSLEVDRQGQVVSLSLAPEWNEKIERYLLGVRKVTGPFKQDLIVKKYSFIDALVEGTKENLRLTGLTFQVLGRLLTFQLSYKNLGGPIRIAQASAAAAQSGAADFLYFMAFLSLQLGILNLLPIPVLDGGHLFFMSIEAVRRKPVSRRVQGIATQLGLFLLLFLMLIVTVNDIDIVWGLKDILEKVRGLF